MSHRDFPDKNNLAPLAVTGHDPACEHRHLCLETYALDYKAEITVFTAGSYRVKGVTRTGLMRTIAELSVH